MKARKTTYSQARNQGFSLVELIVVIAIMAILVGIAVPVYTTYISKASTQVDETTVEEIRHAMELSIVALMAEGETVSISEKVTITMSADGEFTDNSNISGLADEIDAILPEAKRKLKSDEYANGVTFTIGTDYTVTAEPASETTGTGDTGNENDNG